MPLPEPKLDDLDFQSLVNDAKRLISIYCPEWTDHNVSDPGVTLIELFASMVEMLSYRVNRLPEKVYIAFLNMIGARLAPARAATVDVTFYLSGLALRHLQGADSTSGPVPVTIAAGAEVSTLRTETSAPIAFSTAADLVIRSARLLRIARSITDRQRGSLWTQLPANVHGELTGEKRIFGADQTRPQPDNALYFELANDHSNHVLAVIADCERAGGYGAPLDDPPWVWEVAPPEPETKNWRACVVESDGTGGFNRNGENEILLRLPRMEPYALRGPDDKPSPSFWLRCRLTKQQAPPPSVLGAPADRGYWASPIVKHIRIESRGGTVEAHQAIVVKDEVVGITDGTPGQVFRLRYGSLLPRDSECEFLTIGPPGQPEEIWQEVANFARSDAKARHYTLDDDGRLRLGPTLRQPDGSFRSFGMVPGKGRELRMKQYRFGGGAAGDVREKSLINFRTSDPNITRVVNWRAAIGGRDAQRLDDAGVRAADYLNMRAQIVTAEDFKYLLEQQPEVERVICYTPNDLPAGQDASGVRIVVLPRLRATLSDGAFPKELASDRNDPLLARLRQLLQPRTVLGARFQISPPEYYAVSVDATLNVVANYPSDELQKQAEHALYRYLNPYTGGPEGAGWPFGRRLTEWEIVGLLQRLPGVAAVEQVLLCGSRLEDKASADPVPLIELGPGGVFCSATHSVRCADQEGSRGSA